VIEIPSEPNGYASTHHNTIQECKEGSEDGCEFCTHILQTTLGRTLAEGTGIPRINRIAPQGTRMELNVYGDPPLINIKIGAAVIAKNIRIYTLPGNITLVRSPCMKNLTFLPGR
jgi:hypothetical protein